VVSTELLAIRPPCVPGKLCCFNAICSTAAAGAAAGALSLHCHSCYSRFVTLRWCYLYSLRWTDRLVHGQFQLGRSRVPMWSRNRTPEASVERDNIERHTLAQHKADSVLHTAFMVNHSTSKAVYVVLRYVSSLARCSGADNICLVVHYPGCCRISACVVVATFNAHRSSARKD
jgi:hypothetical protein